MQRVQHLPSLSCAVGTFKYVRKKSNELINLLCGETFGL